MNIHLTKLIEGIVNSRKPIESCNPKNRLANELFLFKKVLETKGGSWLIVAMMDGSIGYHTATHSQNIIKAVLEDYPSYCERVMACYNSDLMRMLFLDILHLNRELSCEPESRKKPLLLDMITKMDKLLGMSYIEQMSISMAYPTL